MTQPAVSRQSDRFEGESFSPALAALKPERDLPYVRRVIAKRPWPGIAQASEIRAAYPEAFSRLGVNLHGILSLRGMPAEREVLRDFLFPARAPIPDPLAKHGGLKNFQ